MKPFTLTTVLNYRKRLVNIARHRLFEAKNIQQHIRQKLDDEKSLLADVIDESSRLQVKGIPILKLIRYDERIVFIKSRIAAIEKTLLEKTENVQKEQQSLVQKSKEHQIMEHLKEQQDNSWKAYLNKKEVAMFDEIAILRHDSEPL